MRLIDFSSYEPLNHLKDLMGIPRGTFGSLIITVAPAVLTREELDKLTSGTGVDVSLGDLTTLPDGTFELKGEQVVIYIRDIDDYGRGTDGPRFHVKTCKTIIRMRDVGRMTRYVAASEPEGVFVVNVRHSFGARQERRPLKVCWNCLNEINYDNFARRSLDGKKSIVARCTPAQFFERHPRPLHSHLPARGADTAPLNVYSPNFPEISRSMKDRSGWRCEGCMADLSEPSRRKYLNVHHRDGDRTNDSPSNLKVLCVACHGEEPNHQHMKATPSYREYLVVRGW